ncbi:hypothetical protein [Microbacterium sp. 22242]|uniref:hypothetical protein n=1 Tax=Microbacterium sp. 22242 TaxID=3453896 RepID=UPI003F842C8F
MAEDADHRSLAEALRQRLMSGGDPEVVRAAARIGAGDRTSSPEPYAELARTIDEASYRVTDEQVAAVRRAAGSDRGAFEVVMAAGVGAGLRRWDAALRAIEESGHAPR